MDGASSSSLNTQNESLTVISDGSNWKILDRHIDESWIAYTPTFTNFGTVSSVTVWYKRIGDSVAVKGSIFTGTTAAGVGTVTIPSGLTIDSAKISVNNLTTEVGRAIAAGAGGNAPSYSTGEVVPLIVDTGVLTQVATGQSGTTTFAGYNVTQFLGSSKWFTVDFSVPISGWNGN